MEETRKKKIIKAATAVGLSAVVLCVFGFGYLIGTTSFGSDDVYIDTDPGTNMVFGDSEGSGMSISMLDSEYSLTSTNSTSGETYFTLKATPVTEDGTDVSSAENSTIVWSVEWTDSSASWASGKTASTYVLFADGNDRVSTVTGLTCDVYCSSAFGSQIKVRATLVSDESKTAAVTVDYLQKTESVKLSFGDVECDFDSGETGVTLQANEYGEASGGTPTLVVTQGNIYTISQTITSNYALTAVGGSNYSITFEDTDTYQTTILGDAYSDVRILEYTVNDLTLSGTPVNYFWAFAEYQVSSNSKIFNVGNGLNYYTACSTTGLYFGAKWFSENLGFHFYSCYDYSGGAETSVVSTGLQQHSLFDSTLSYGNDNGYYESSSNRMLLAFDNKDGSTSETKGGAAYLTYSYLGGLNLFDLNLTLKGSYQYADGTYYSTSYSTTFYISDVINTAAIDGIELDPTGIVF